MLTHSAIVIPESVALITPGSLIYLQSKHDKRMHHCLVFHHAVSLGHSAKIRCELENVAQ